MGGMETWQCHGAAVCMLHGSQIKHGCAAVLRCRAAATCMLQGKTQLVKGKLQSLPEEQAALSLSMNYFSDVAGFQKVGQG